MINSYRIVNWRLVGFWLAVAFTPLAGCLAPDNTPIVQVVPRIVVAPQNPHFKAIDYLPLSQPPTGSLLAIWNRSTADTQQNFKGYFVQLYSSSTDSLGNEDTIALIGSATILRNTSGATDTTYTFPNIKLGRYMLFVYSEKTSTSDTVIYSSDSSYYFANYDPRPLHDPAYIVATSAGPNSVELHWSLSVSDKSYIQGFYQYVIYYKDTTIENDSGHIAAIVGRGIDSAIVSVNGPVITGSTGATTEYPFRYWVKSERIDSTFFYGGLPGVDSNCITWAGAQAVPVSPNDSGYNSGYRKIITSMYFGSNNGQWDVVDSGLGAQVGVIIDNNAETVSLFDSAGSNFITALSGGSYDTASSLTSIFYTWPLTTPLGPSSITLPQTVSDSGVIVYLQIKDDINSPPLSNSPEWARIFIRKQANGTFINPYTNGIDIRASFQPGTSKDGSTHLFYY